MLGLAISKVPCVVKVKKKKDGKMLGLVVKKVFDCVILSFENLVSQ